MPPTDPQLLSRYLDSKDESAFTALVSRHLPLIRGILHRSTGGRAELVDELAMQVFATLAQRADSLKNRPTVAGWLVLTARNKAAEAIRNDSTRQKYMNRLAAEPNTSPESAGLEEATPHLDDALAALPENDREAVLLHFYEKLPYREVGDRIGKKEDTTRKRVNRSLENMGTFLRGRGVTLSATALAGGLTTQLTSHASGATSASIIAKQALASALPATVAKLSAVKLAIAGSAILAASTAASYFSAKPQPSLPAPNSPAVESKRLTAIQPTTAKLVPDLESAVAPLARLSVPERVRALTELWEKSRRKPSEGYWYIFSALVEKFPPEDCAEALDILDRDYADNNERHWRIAYRLADKMAKANPEATARHAIAKIQAGNHHWENNRRLGVAIGHWAQSDPLATQTWFDAQAFSRNTQKNLREHLIPNTSASAPKAALKAALALPMDEQEHAISLLQSPDREINLTLVKLVADLDEETRAAVVDGALLNPLLDHNSLRSALAYNQIARNEARGPYKDETGRHHSPLQIATISEPELNPSAFEAVFAQLNFTRSDAVVPLIDKIVDRRISHDSSQYAPALDFAVKHLPEQAMPHLLDRYVRKWLKKDPDAAGSWLNGMGLTGSDVEAATASFNLR